MRQRPIPYQKQQQQPQQQEDGADRQPGLIELVALKEGTDGSSASPGTSFVGQVVSYWQQDVRTTVTLQPGDEVRLSVIRLKRADQLVALNIELLRPHNEGANRVVGPISDLKEHFGFIELPTARGEIFFHYS